MDDDQDVIRSESLAGLPGPVQRYLLYSGVVGKPRVKTVWLKQVGRFRRGIDQPWMPMTAQQFYTVTPPGFVWDARFKVSGLPLLRARDTYRKGEGHMFARLAGVFPVFDVRNEKLTQGAMVRFLQEMMWFPAAYLEPCIQWTAVDDTCAKVSFVDCGKTVSGRMYFNEQGQVVDFSAKRYREDNGAFTLDTWSTPIGRYGELAGLNLPLSGKAVWKLAESDLTYAELDIVDVRYNPDPALLR